MQLFVVSDFVVRINNKIHNIDKGVHFLLHLKRKDIIGSGVSFNHFYLQIRFGHQIGLRKFVEDSLFV